MRGAWSELLPALASCELRVPRALLPMATQLRLLLDLGAALAELGHSATVDTTRRALTSRRPLAPRLAHRSLGHARSRPV